MPTKVGLETIGYNIWYNFVDAIIKRDWVELVKIGWIPLLWNSYKKIEIRGAWILLDFQNYVIIEIYPQRPSAKTQGNILDTIHLGQGTNLLEKSVGFIISLPWWWVSSAAHSIY